MIERLMIISRSGRSPMFKLTLPYCGGTLVSVLYRPPRYLFLINFFFCHSCLSICLTACLLAWPACLPTIIRPYSICPQSFSPSLFLSLPIYRHLSFYVRPPVPSFNGRGKNMRRGVKNKNNNNKITTTDLKGRSSLSNSRKNSTFATFLFLFLFF